MDDSHLTTTANNNNILESFFSFWNSLSSQSQFLALTSALGAFAFILFILFICCVFCCKNSGRRRRRKFNKNGGQQCGEIMNEDEGCGGGGTNVCVGGTLQQPESASSMISGSLAKQQKLSVHPYPQQQHILMHNCNGGIVGGSAGGGSTTLSGSDMNSAFYRKVRDERIRLGNNAEELLNPLLPSIEQQHFQIGYQQQLFEMPQQQFRPSYWDNSGTLNSATASAYPPPHGSAYYAPQSMKSQQVILKIKYN